VDDLEILRRTDALRALARGLLADPHDAEDVVQDAWVAALENGERPRDLVAWLRGTTRRLVAQAVRGRERRRRRELAAARPEAAPFDAAAEAGILRALAAELARLEEPYRTVLVLRYYHDRRPPEIAAQLSIPVATVKTRLRRGLAILRARLSREDRSWALVLAPLVVRRVRVGLVLAALGACGAAALLTIGFWPGRARETRRAETAAVEPAGPAESRGAPGAAADTRQVRADVLVEGPDGPVAGAEVKIAPLDRWTETTAARTDANGVVRFDPPIDGAYEVTADAKGLVSGGVFARFPGTARVLLRSGCRLRLKLDPWPDPAWAAFRWWAQGSRRAHDLVVDAAEIDTGVWPAGIVSISCCPKGGGLSHDVRIALPSNGEVVHELHPPAAEATTVQVVDGETGEIVPDWTASLLDPWTLKASALDREPGASAGLYRLSAGGRTVSVDADGYARAFVRLPRDGDGPVRVALLRGATLRISFPAGARPREVRIDYNAPAGATWSRGISGGPGVSLAPGEELNLTDLGWDAAYLVRRLTDADAWTAAGLPPEARLDIIGLDEEGLFTFRQVETGPPGTEASVELDWPPTARHRFLVRDESGNPVPGAEIRIVDTRWPGHDIPLGSISTDASGRGSVRGFRTDLQYAIQLVHRGGAERQTLILSGPDSESVLTTVEQEREQRRVLVLDGTGHPVVGARVQFDAREGLGAFAVTGEDGIAVGAIQAGCALSLVAVCPEPGGGGEFEAMFNPPPDDPIVYRVDLGKVRVSLEIEGEGLVDAQLKGGKRDQDLSVYVHGRGTAAFLLRVEPGEYRVEATLGGSSVLRPLVACAGEPAVVPLRFDR